MSHILALQLLEPEEAALEVAWCVSLLSSLRVGTSTTA